MLKVLQILSAKAQGALSFYNFLAQGLEYLYYIEIKYYGYSIHSNIWLCT